MTRALGDSGAAIDFLKLWDPAGPWPLSAITPDTRAIETRTFAPAEEADLRAWLDGKQGTKNLYFLPNRPRGALAKKATKADMLAGVALHVDIDARAGFDVANEVERITTALDEFEPPPSLTIASGGGVQAYWLLDRPCDDLGAVEDRNRALERALGGDHCHNIDRIMRLPGTINVPDAKKRAKGRVTALARLVRDGWATRYPLELFPALPKQAEHAPKVDEKARNGHYRPWSEDVPDAIKDLIRTGDASGHGGDRSRAVWAVACELARAGAGEVDIAGVLLDPANGISAHVRDQPRPGPYAARQAAEAAAQGGDFARDEKKRVIPNSQRNIRLALTRIGVGLSHDEFADRLLIEGPGDLDRRHLSESEVEHLYMTIDARFKFKPSVEFFWMFVKVEARRRAFHPVRDYLAGLEWDGVERIDRWLITYCGAEDTEINRAVGRLALVAAARRVRHPGVKYDEMIVIESEQGADKSSLLAALAVDAEWFYDDLPLNADTKEIIEKLRGKWIVEAAELTGMRKGEIEHVKAFLSRTVDRARPAWGRMTVEVPRQCVLFGTTNTGQYLKDMTGNRRFWPVAGSVFDVVAMARDRDQLWAEAAAAEARGESIRLDPRLYSAAAEAQEGRKVTEPWIGVIDAHLGKVSGGKIWTQYVWDIVGVRPEHRTQEHNSRIGTAMQALGWKREKRSFDNKIRWCYVKGTAEQKEKVSIMVFRDRDTGAVTVDIAPLADAHEEVEEVPF